MSQDENAIREMVAELGDVDFLINDSSGLIITSSYLAAYLRLPVALKVLIKAGSSLDFNAGGVTTRMLCLNSPRLVGALKASGIELSAAELGAHYIQTTSDPSALSDLGSIAASVLNDYADDSGDFTERTSDILGDERGLHLVLESSSFRSRFSGAFATIESSGGAGGPLGTLAGQLEGQMRNIAEGVSSAIQLGCSVQVTYTKDVERACIRHFSGYRRNTQWLAKRLSLAADELCEQIAPAMGFYEDDDLFRAAIELAISRYPIEESLIGRAGAPLSVSGAQFEAETAVILTNAGFSIRRVGATGDQGADLIAEKDGLTYAVQCKDYAEAVGNAAVQQALAAKSFYRTDYAVVCAPAGFTKSAKALAASSDVILTKPIALGSLEALRLAVE